MVLNMVREYEFDNNIELMEKELAKFVENIGKQVKVISLQVPEGLKTRALDIAEFLEYENPREAIRDHIKEKHTIEFEKINISKEKTGGDFSSSIKKPQKHNFHIRSWFIFPYHEIQKERSGKVSRFRDRNYFTINKKNGIILHD